MGRVDHGLAAFDDRPRLISLQRVMAGNHALGRDGDIRQHDVAGVLSGDTIRIVNIRIEVRVAISSIHELRNLGGFLRPHSPDRVLLRRSERHIVSDAFSDSGSPRR